MDVILMRYVGRERKMKVVCGDEMGLVKEVHFGKQQSVTTFGKQHRDYAVKAMCWAGHGPEASDVYSRFMVAKKNGVVQLYNR